MFNAFLENPLNFLLWGSIVISVMTSLIRACNIGFQRTTYILSALSLLPVIYDVSTNGSRQVIIFNTFHLIVAIFGAYRWSNHQTNDEEQEQHFKTE